MCAARLLRISAANIGPNRFHQNRTVSWLTSIPRSAKILDVAKRQRVLHVHQHRQTDYLWRAVEIPERVARGPKLTTGESPRNWSDRARARVNL